MWICRIKQTLESITRAKIGFSLIVRVTDEGEKDSYEKLRKKRKMFESIQLNTGAARSQNLHTMADLWPSFQQAITLANMQRSTHITGHSLVFSACHPASRSANNLPESNHGSI